MHNMKKKSNQSSNSNSSSSEVPTHKERHIVSWSQEEDDILREQIRIHGTDNWGIIASKFKDKTTRQCRRRWFTYLNSDFKKGGWSPEEDMLLCEAQKIFGNRWTEISKVVSGRTDNAVKNRFSTLCKKRAKCAALAKENNSAYINSNNKRVLFHEDLNTDRSSETLEPKKKMRRAHISDLTENQYRRETLCKEASTSDQQLRPPFAVLVQNFHTSADVPNQQYSNNSKETCNNDPKTENNKKLEGMFLKKDDPKIQALMQQAELLSSLALKVNTDNTDQSLENAWKALQGFLNHTNDSDMLRYKKPDMDVQLEYFMGLMEDLRSSNEGSQQSWRQPDLYDESPGSSEHSTGSNLPSLTRGQHSTGSTMKSHSEGKKTAQNQTNRCAQPRETEVKLQSTHLGEQNGSCEDENIQSGAKTDQADILPAPDNLKTENEVVSTLPCTEFSSPLHVTPLFSSLAAGIPSPKFSESERNFLLKALGVESASPSQSANPSQTPLCKRALLQSL